MDSSYLMFVGSYTNFDILAHLPHNDKLGKGVYCLRFDNGTIEPICIIPSENPAVISCHPKNENIMYILEEGIVNHGVIHQVDIIPTVSYNKTDKKCGINLEISNERRNCTEGRSLCYFRIHPKYSQYGIAINYWEGSVDVFLMDDKTGVCKKIVQHIEHINIALNENKQRRLVINREDHWSNRQVGSHAHSIHFYKQWVFIPDLGENSIFQYRFEPKSNDAVLQYECQIYLENGAGPRHMVFHPTLPIAYVSNELNSTITVLLIDDKIDKEGDLEDGKTKHIQQRMKIIQTIATSNDDLVNKKNYVAEICISPDGNYVYVSNRGHDLIGIFKVDYNNNGTLTSVDYVSVYGKCPRHFAITPDGRYMLVCNQDSNSIVIFNRNISNGLLKYSNIFTHETFGAPNYLFFYPLSVPKMLLKQQKKEEEQIQIQQYILNKKINHNQVVSKTFNQQYVWGIMLLCFAFVGFLSVFQKPL